MPGPLQSAIYLMRCPMNRELEQAERNESRAWLYLVFVMREMGFNLARVSSDQRDEFMRAVDKWRHARNESDRALKRRS